MSNTLLQVQSGSIAPEPAARASEEIAEEPLKEEWFAEEMHLPKVT